ncbi:MAG: acetyl-CoA decarbonylase/synthase complex subunit delta, partial [Anaerolineales bacterium]
EELEAWVKEKEHPVLDMGPMEAKKREEPTEEDVIAQAEAVVEAVMAEPDKGVVIEEVPPEPVEEAPAAEVEASPAEPPVSVAPAPSAPDGSVEQRVERLERAVTTLITSLVDALAEIGEVDASQVAVTPKAAPPAPAEVVPTPEPEPEPLKIELPPDQPWLTEDTKTEILKESWSGSVRVAQIGATVEEGGTRTSVVVVGGETAMPFMDFEGEMPNKPVVAIEIKDRRPEDWSELLTKEWGDVMDDPGEWAKAAEKAGAEMILLSLSLTDADDNPTKPEDAVAAVKKVLEATGLPLAVFGPGQADADNDLLVPISDTFKGERLLLGVCEDKNYRTIAASAMANGHLVNARTAMDVNLAKQLNILINDMGLPLERIVMDPTTGALGYGFEYGYSVMERLRLAALQGDSMTQMPMLVTPGEECWKAKESKVGEGVPEEWGDWLERAIAWEALTSVMLIESGANIVVLRHPESVRRTLEAIEELTDRE